MIQSLSYVLLVLFGLQHDVVFGKLHFDTFGVGRKLESDNTPLTVDPWCNSENKTVSSFDLTLAGWEGAQGYFVSPNIPTSISISMEYSSGINGSASDLVLLVTDLESFYFFVGGYGDIGLSDVVTELNKTEEWPSSWNSSLSGKYEATLTNKFTEFTLSNSSECGVNIFFFLGNGRNGSAPQNYVGTLTFNGSTDFNCTYNWKNVCSYYQYETLRNQIAAKVASNTQKITSIEGIHKVVCEGECVPYLEVEAARSLKNIMANHDKGRLILESAYQGPVEEFLYANWTAYANPCSHREWKNLHEDPVKDAHDGCSIDMSIRDVHRWSDIFISKGWIYSQPTLDKHHFEFLKCGSTPTSVDGVTAFQELWNEANAGNLSGGILDTDTSAALNEMMKEGESFSPDENCTPDN